MRWRVARSVVLAPIVVALTIGAAACSSHDADTGNVVEVSVSIADGTESAGWYSKPPTDAELLTARDLAELTPSGVSSASPWTEGDRRLDWDSDMAEPYSIHICGLESPTLKWFPEFAELDHVDRAHGAGTGSVAEAVFAGTSDELAEVYESVVGKLSDCLANPQEMVEPGGPLTDDGFDVKASRLSQFGLRSADFGLHQQIVDLCDHRLALVLSNTRLVVVEFWTGYHQADRFDDSDFETLVERAVRQANA